MRLNCLKSQLELMLRSDRSYRLATGIVKNFNMALVLFVCIYQSYAISLSPPLISFTLCIRTPYMYEPVYCICERCTDCLSLWVHVLLFWVELSSGMQAYSVLCSFFSMKFLVFTAQNSVRYEKHSGRHSILRFVWKNEQVNTTDNDYRINCLNSWSYDLSPLELAFNV